MLTWLNLDPTHGMALSKGNETLAGIYGVQKAISNWLSSSLLNLENKLQKELGGGGVLDQKRDLWMLKFRINWLVQGDCNTSFYHVSALARRKRNHIASVKDKRGVWLTDEREVLEHFRSGFVSLYTTSLQEAYRFLRHDVRGQVQLSEEAKDFIGAMVTLKEIKNALWSTKPYKASGSDGLHARFFQRFWLVVGESVVEEVRRVFIERKVPDYLNRTSLFSFLKSKTQKPLVITDLSTYAILFIRSSPRLLWLNLDCIWSIWPC